MHPQPDQEEEILRRYELGSSCQEIAAHLSLPIHLVVSCLLRGAVRDRIVLRRAGRNHDVPLGAASDRKHPGPAHRPPPPQCLVSGRRAGHDPRDARDELRRRSSGAEPSGPKCPRGWLVTPEEFAAIFSADRGQFNVIRLKQPQHGPPKPFMGEPKLAG